MTGAFTESVVEQAALAWFESTGWAVSNGAAIAPGEPAAERDDYGHVVLAQRLRDALARVNPALPAEALDDAFRKLTRPEGAELVARSRALHRLLVDGVTESVVEAAALAWLEVGGWQVAHGPGIGPVQLSAQRAGYGEWLLAERLMRRIDS